MKNNREIILSAVRRVARDSQMDLEKWMDAFEGKDGLLPPTLFVSRAMLEDMLEQARSQGPRRRLTALPFPESEASRAERLEACVRNYDLLPGHCKIAGIGARDAVLQGGYRVKEGSLLHKSFVYNGVEFKEVGR